MSVPAREARDNCFRVCKERGFLLHVPTKGRAPPKWAPEMGMSRGYRLGPQRRAWTTNAAAAATRNPVCKCRSLRTHLQEPVQHTTARVQWYGDNFPGRTHGGPQAVVMSRWPLPPQDHPAFQLWLPNHSLSPASMSKRTLISHCFNPLLCEHWTDTWRGLTCTGSAKTKAEPQEQCEQRKEREIFMCSIRSSRLNPHNQLDKTCISGITE